MVDVCLEDYASDSAPFTHACRSNTISIVETCRRLDIKLREYLQAILPKLGEWPITRVAELTPSAWKAAQTS